MTVSIFDRDLETLDARGQTLRRHEKSARKGSFTLEGSDRLFNPSRETTRLLRKARLIDAHTTLAVGRGYIIHYREAHQFVEDLIEARELGTLRKRRR